VVLIFHFSNVSRGQTRQGLKPLTRYCLYVMPKGITHKATSFPATIEFCATQN